jgi:hypothetical protein
MPSSSPDGGIRMSVTTTSGSPAAIASRRSSPLSHTATTSMRSSVVSKWAIASRTR